MKTLPAGAITCLAEEGRLTLQVPEISLGGYVAQDHPDEYFIPVRYPDDIAVGKEEGFTYLSRIGYNHYRADLQKAFNSRQTRGSTFGGFHVEALAFLDRVKVKGNRKLKKLNALAQANPTKYNIRKRDEMVEYLKRV
jgi:hypothetical protein